MDRSAASAYVYAKASGILAKSFIGARAEKLFSIKSLRDLYGMLFPGDIPAVPETVLAKTIEQLAEKHFLDEYQKLLLVYSKPDSVLVYLLRFYDYDNLKEIGAALCNRESKIPSVASTGQFSMLDYSAWPDLAKITANSSVSWYNKIPHPDEQKELDTKLDKQYIRELWSSIEHLHLSERKPVEEFIKKELSFNNIVWAVRLRVYYKMDAEEIKSRLAFADESKDEEDVLAGEAISILEKDTGSWDDWKDWKYRDLLNPHEEGIVWGLDPGWLEHSVKRVVVDSAMRSFHKYPFTAMVLVCWFKIKQYELDCIRAVAEGFRLDVDPQQVMSASSMTQSAQS